MPSDYRLKNNLEGIASCLVCGGFRAPLFHFTSLREVSKKLASHPRSAWKKMKAWENRLKVRANRALRTAFRLGERRLRKSNQTGAARIAGIRR
jgi:hypothetical protein